MFTPFDYQSECLGELAKARAAGKQKGLVVMASGLGKTFTVAFDVQTWLKSAQGRFLYLCDQNDILYQARTTFETVLGDTASFGYYNGEEKSARGKEGVFASFQTMGKHLRSFSPTEFAYIVVDESHHSHADTYRNVIKHFTPAWLLGVTATPDRMDGQDIRDMYGPELFYLPLETAIARGLLTPVDYRLLADEVSIDAIEKKIGSIRSVKDLNRMIFTPKQDAEIAQIVAKHAAEFSDPRIIYFTSSLDRCDELCGHLPDAIAIHSRVPVKERNIRTELFRQGLVNTVVTVDCFNEGIDIPQANVVVFLRSTESPTIFFQQLGRGLRKSEGKDKVIVLDFVGNCERIKMVRKMWSKIEREREEYNRRSTGTRHTRMASHVDKLQFSEKIVQIADLLEQIRPKYVSEIPRLAEDYSTKNPLPANTVYARTGALLLWECHTCHFEWRVAGTQRLRGSKCPACEGRVVTTKNNLGVLYPELAKEYSTKNEVPPSQIVPASRQPLWWKCTDPVCGYEWVETGTSRLRRSHHRYGCPECFERVSLNRLSIEHPDIFSEYSERNVLPSSAPWWNCRVCGYEWKARTAARTRANKPTGCSVCTGRIVTEKTRLDLVYPDLVKELLNPSTASTTSIHDKHKHLWHCSHCRKDWWATLQQRIADRNCPKCSKKKKQVGPAIASNEALQREYSGRNLLTAGECSLLSLEKCMWDCFTCGFSFEASPHERMHEDIGCPICSVLG